MPETSKNEARRQAQNEYLATAVTVQLNAALLNEVVIESRKERRKMSAQIDFWIDAYLSGRELDPLPEGARLKRSVAGKGETKARRYVLSPETFEKLQEAEALGYSRSWIVEEAVKEGLVGVRHV